MSDLLDTFLAITGSSDSTAAQNFLEMSGNDLDVAISLYFEHAGSASNNNSSNLNTGGDSGTGSTSISGAEFETDEQLAERLQNEAYKTQQEEPRAPMEAVHERLVGGADEGGMFSSMMGGSAGGFGGYSRGSPFGGNVAEQIYGNGRRGVFNQVDEFDNTRIQEIDDDDIDEDSGEETAEKRLARIFRPPFDLINKIDLNSARTKARTETKWVLVNIQDTSDFQCQILNRDFWSNSSVKELVKEHFVFLQYHKDSLHGQQYVNFYPFDKFPHIAILDPITGERLKQWNQVPQVSGWLSQVYDFLNEFSLDPGSVNPTVKHKTKVDVNSLSEEKQLEYAIQQSLNKNKNNDDDDGDLSSDDMDYSDANDSLQILETGDQDDPIDLDSDDEEAVVIAPPKELTDQEKIARIQPLKIEEPTEGDVTRIQVRTGDGKRVVRKFKVDDKVENLYAFVKNYLIEEGVGGEAGKDLFFVLTSTRVNLIDKLDVSIEEAGLKNASVLVEVIEDDDE